MTKVKVFVYGRRRRRGYDNSSPDFRHGELKTQSTNLQDFTLLLFDITHTGQAIQSYTPEEEEQACQ